VPDPALGCPADRADMIVGEVKEGAARFNPAIRDPFALEIGWCASAVVSRRRRRISFGGCLRPER
jgi:hypothetical protein